VTVLGRIAHAASDPRIPEVLREAIKGCRHGFVAVVVFSFCINVLMLTVSIYMLPVYDSVLTTRSIDTLIFLTLMAMAALLALAGLEALRTRLMVRLSLWIDHKLSGEVLSSAITASLRFGTDPSVQGLRDVSTVRSFLTGPGAFPILDAPWTPVFLVVVFILHPWLGVLSLLGAIAIFGLALANELATRHLIESSGVASIKALQQAEAAARNANVIGAMGMMQAIERRWSKQNMSMLDLQAQASIRSGWITALSKFLRQALQISLLGFGAWLALQHEITPGTMIAASILMARALAPVEQAIGSWRVAIAARAAYQRIEKLLAEMPARVPTMKLPSPVGRLSVEAAMYFYPGAQEPTIRGVSFKLEPGEALGLIGPTASGKTTLVELLVGNLPPRSGHVRLDGGDITQWDPEDRRRYVGYLPQDIELFRGTVADNIARMGDAAPEDIIAAAKIAGVHETILRLPRGYNTDIGDSGSALSGGQRQRIALARAVFGSPKFVVLDEPNANLDHDGEERLLEAIRTLKEQRATLVVIAHRPSVLRYVDKVLVMKNGAIEAFGPRDQVVPMVTQPQAATAAPAATSR
jgi:ATP-binding cassette subfamily B protein/ATP-binding cassette subfamily C protein